MPIATYSPLANITLSGSASSITFSSIPSGYRDLIIVCDGTAGTTSGNLSINVSFNGDTTSNNYPSLRMAANGVATASSSETPFIGTMGNLQSNLIIQIFDYSASDKHKPVLSRQNSTGNNLVSAYALRWTNLSAISSLTLGVQSTQFNAGTTAALYGILS
jgi:hypothetical protein